MKLQTGLILCCFIVAATGLKGKEPPKKREAQGTPLETQLIDHQVSELMADRVGLRTEMPGGELAAMDCFSREELLASEALRFPADELYGGWDTCWVNPFRSREIAIPDSFRVDCSAFTSPVDNQVKITSKYGPRRRRMHRGIDLKVYVGDTIRAAFDGKVRIKSFERRGYGNYLVIRHPNGLETVYGHLSKHLVSENDIVRSGQPVALGGNTGRSTGSHLHFEVRFLGQAIDPADMIDFENGAPHSDSYVFYKAGGKNSNIYTSTSERLAYHRVKKGETLSVIARKYRISVAELCRLNGIKSSSRLRIGQSLRCGTTAVTAAVKDTATAVAKAAGEAAAETTAAVHKVQPKETLFAIARQYGTTVDVLCRLNGIRSTDALRPGQEIRYRAAARQAAPKPDAATAAAEADAPEAAATAEAAPPAAPANKAVYYRVRQGDTLGAIARRHGVSVTRLCEMNRITTSTILKVGRSLRCS
jgi:murein DD-endopeptidase MepM/ murein hydrolase activator NlpD